MGKSIPQDEYDFLDRVRRALIMQLGAVEDRMGKKRSIKPSEERKKEGQGR